MFRQSHWPTTTNFTQPGLRYIIHPENRLTFSWFLRRSTCKKKVAPVASGA